MTAIHCLHRGWREALVDLVACTRNELVIAAPFITDAGTRLIEDNLSSTVKANGKLEMITDLSPAHVCDGLLDTDALMALSSSTPSCSIWHVPALHAKVYIADAERAIVTSGNMTAGAYCRNVEYGVEIADATLVRTIRSDIADFQLLGTAVNRDAMQQYADVARAVRDSFTHQRAQVDPKLKKAFGDAVRKAENELIRLRLSGGAMHTVFGKTIELLLRRQGPLPTTTIHQLIQQLHPDLCDDSVDRVIDGKNFGKKWKHAVRTAQQNLKKQGIIEYNGQMWRLTVAATGVP